MWEIALIIAVIVFSITCFFVIKTLIALQQSVLALKTKVENLSDEATTALRLVEARLMLFDSIFRTFSNVGEIAETKTAQWKASLIEPSPLREEKINLGGELVEWALTSAHLYQQIFKKGGKK